MKNHYGHELTGVERIEISGWPEGAARAMVIESAAQVRLEIEVDQREGETWTFNKENLPVLKFFSSAKRQSAVGTMFIWVPKDMTHMVHFVE